MASLAPPTIYYGSKVPDIRVEMIRGEQRHYCRRNRNLHLTDKDFTNGTYEAGRLLGSLCWEFCLPQRRGTAAPCPGFAKSHSWYTDDKRLADVEAETDLERCPGVQALLDLTQTDEERHFLALYLNLTAYHEHEWREELIGHWNLLSHKVEDDFLYDSRDKLDRALWRTLRFPALIPQVWLNWVWASSEEHMRVLDDNPSRVDFAAFYKNRRHIVEIDGPNHYADFDETTRTYSVNERAYAFNLRVARSLEREGWKLTRIARIEVRDTMDDEDVWAKYKLMRILPFPGSRTDYPPRLSCADLGLPELELDKIPF